jgi:hypothetical protein
LAKACGRNFAASARSISEEPGGDPVFVTADIMPGVARLATGAWFDPGEDLERNGNPNVLTLDRGSSAFAQGCAAQTCLVDARRHQGEIPAVTVYEPPPLRRDARVAP